MKIYNFKIITYRDDCKFCSRTRNTISPWKTLKIFKRILYRVHTDSFSFFNECSFSNIASKFSILKKWCQISWKLQRVIYILLHFMYIIYLILLIIVLCYVYDLTFLVVFWKSNMKICFCGSPNEAKYMFAAPGKKKWSLDD